MIGLNVVFLHFLAVFGQLTFFAENCKVKARFYDCFNPTRHTVKRKSLKKTKGI